MWDIVGRIVVAMLTAYFLGNINGAITVSSLLDRDDVRSHGSGNAGMTNYMRSYGPSKTGLVLAIDLGKALLSCFAGGMLLAPYGLYTEGAMLSGFCVSLGHDLPILHGFHGGKGILCGLGFALVADWRIALIILAVFLILVAATRYVSLGSCGAAVALGICFMAFHWSRSVVWCFGWAACVLALFMHRENIKRLLQGSERKLSFHHKEEQK